MDFKIFIGLISVILVLVGYVPYIIDILKRKVTPHTFTFLIWSLASSITWALQVYGGAGAGAWITFVVTAVCIFIFLLCLKYGEKSITFWDVAFLLLAIFSLFLWLVVKQPVLSMIFLVLTDVLGFGPTVRKTWQKPQSETLFTWWMAGFRHGLSVLALKDINLVTALYPVVWSIINILFCLMVLIRRKSLSK
jgi:hypothetical protein